MLLAFLVYFRLSLSVRFVHSVRQNTYLCTTSAVFLQFSYNRCYSNSIFQVRRPCCAWNVNSSNAIFDLSFSKWRSFIFTSWLVSRLECQSESWVIVFIAASVGPEILRMIAFYSYLIIAFLFWVAKQINVTRNDISLISRDGKLLIFFNYLYVADYGYRLQTYIS